MQCDGPAVMAASMVPFGVGNAVSTVCSTASSVVEKYAPLTLAYKPHICIDFASSTGFAGSLELWLLPASTATRVPLARLVVAQRQAKG